MVNTIPVLKERNTGVVIRDVHENSSDREAPEAIQGKGKGKVPYCAKGKENQTPSETSVLSEAAAAQRARREREKLSISLLSSQGTEILVAHSHNGVSRAALSQQAHRERERTSNNNYNTPQPEPLNDLTQNICVSKASLAPQARHEREKTSRQEFNTPPTASPNDLNPPAISKATLAQRARREREINSKSDGASCCRKRNEPESVNDMENFPQHSVMLPPTPSLLDGLISERTPLTSTLPDHYKRRHMEDSH